MKLTKEQARSVSLRLFGLSVLVISVTYYFISRDEGAPPPSHPYLAEIEPVRGEMRLHSPANHLATAVCVWGYDEERGEWEEAVERSRHNSSALDAVDDVPAPLAHDAQCVRVITDASSERYPQETHSARLVEGYALARERR